MRIRFGHWAAAVLAIGSAAHAQSPSTSAPVEIPAIPAAVPYATTQPLAINTPPPPPKPPATQPTASGQLGNVVVTSDLDQARDQIAPGIGAVRYTVGPSQIQSTPQGDNAPFQQILLRAPGVVQDSFGQEHVRGEHANLTYRVNGVLLPEGLNGFGQELDSRIVESVSLVDGSLPAEFGLHTAGIVDVTTKSGSALSSNEISLYGGSYNTHQPSLQLGGTDGKWDYFIAGSSKHSDIGIENPTPDIRPIHDDTNQQKLFAYLSYHIDDTSRISFLLNASNADFQLPNIPGLAPAFPLAGRTADNSSAIDENQNEQDYYSVISYQKTVDKLSLQLSVYSRYEQIQFDPDEVNDLIFQGVAGRIYNSFLTNGLQFDNSYILNDQHTIRSGLVAEIEGETLNTNTAVFPVDPVSGAPSSDMPFSIVDDSNNRATTVGFYLQDEWRLTHSLTLNYGVRYDHFDSNFDSEGQFSPRVNLVWKIDSKTTLHGGYSRYFVPPPLQNVSSQTLAQFTDTTNAPANFQDDPPRAERSNYFDVGISRQITQPWQVNLDGFYKQARNLIDLGQFGEAVILSPFNYNYAHVYGAELSTTYKSGGFSTFGNFSWVVTNGRDIDSQQFQFDPDELAYINSHYIKLDHDGTYTASAGASYTWKNNMVYLDVLYGSGLRAGFANLQKEPQYAPVNIGYQHIFHPNGMGKNVVKLRCDITNIFDESYQLRNATGIGVGAPQYGQRRGFFVGLAYDF
jgi:outer membrane receptor protein involved in Fe transport